MCVCCVELCGEGEQVISTLQKTVDSWIWQNQKIYIWWTKAFPILMFYGADLVTPRASSGKTQSTVAEAKQTKNVANLPIHVERAIGRVKLLSYSAEHFANHSCALYR